MFANKTFMIILGLLLIVVLGSAFSNADNARPKRNLKILPKNISDEKLDSIMDGFKAALGVECTFCHAKSKDNPEHLNFASDEKGEKLIARKMMRMTNRINKKYFHFNKSEDPLAIQAVRCITCHRGNPHPEDK